MILMVVGIALPACSKSGGGWFAPRKTPQQWLDQALDAPTADERRAGVNGLAASDACGEDWAHTAFDTIARTDTSPMVRCAAIRGLGRSSREGDVATLVKIMRSGTAPLDDVRPAPGAVRWEAAKVLLGIIDRCAYAENQRGEIVECLLERLAKDDDRDVRLTAAESLAYFAQQPVPAALVNAMRTDDFAMAHACEKSLIALTGVAHDHDPDAWAAWLSAAYDPFANAGKLIAHEPPSARESFWPW